MDIFSGIPGMSSDQTPMGLPNDPQSGLPPGFSTVGAAVNQSPLISTAQGWWTTIKNDSTSAVDWVESEASAASAAISGGATSLMTSAENAVVSPLKSVYSYAIIGVIVLVAGLYFIGRSGIVGQAASFGKPV